MAPTCANFLGSLGCSKWEIIPASDMSTLSFFCLHLPLPPYNCSLQENLCEFWWSSDEFCSCDFSLHLFTLDAVSVADLIISLVFSALISMPYSCCFKVFNKINKLLFCVFDVLCWKAFLVIFLLLMLAEHSHSSSALGINIFRNMLSNGEETMQPCWIPQNGLKTMS